ncbi:MAG TPA: hypothetical protein P5511_04070, partial [Candidatus Goldiibacteriota bacterium]|nr:hypothetical protein [Candidatus Goldiibacteriota bacterium]
AGTAVYLPFSSPLTIQASSAAAVTIYADIATVTSRLYFRLAISGQQDIYALEANSGSQIGTVQGVYPFRTGVSTILSTPGIKVSGGSPGIVSVSAGQSGAAAVWMKFANIGSLTEQVRGITITVKDGFGTPIPAQNVILNAYFQDSSHITRASAAAAAGPYVYLDLSADPLSIAPQAYQEGSVYFDVPEAAVNSEFSISVEAGSITGTAAVSADSGYVFPLASGTIALQLAASGISVSYTDLMPPNVSTGQSSVRVMRFTVSNTATAGSAPAVLYYIRLMTLNEAGASIPAKIAVSRIVLTDLAQTYLDTTDLGDTQYLPGLLSGQLELMPGESRDIYAVVDVADNTFTASSFRLSLLSGSSAHAYDKNSAAQVTVSAAAGKTFPMESSAAVIQKKAHTLKISGGSAVPAYVSTDQENVKALELVLEDAGDTGTASIMITRFNISVFDASGAAVNASSVIKKISITSFDGATVYGQADPGAGPKATVNLTAPIIVSAASPVTVLVKVDIASSAAGLSFKAGLESLPDVYAVDANSFGTVAAAEAYTGALPCRSAAALIEGKQTGIDLADYSALAPAGVTRGQRGVPLMAFSVGNNALTGTADALIMSARLWFRDNSGNPIAANSVVEYVYFVDNEGNTLFGASAGYYDNISASYLPVRLTPGSAVRVTVFANIISTASAASFKALMTSGQDIVILDENSGLETVKNISAVFPWESGTAAIYDAPATDLYAWNNSMMPTQVGKGQSKVMAMALSLYNPGGQGTSDVLFKGITMAVCDSSGTVMAPSSALDFLEFTDLTGTYFYGGVTLNAENAAAPF